MEYSAVPLPRDTFLRSTGIKAGLEKEKKKILVNMNKTIEIHSQMKPYLSHLRKAFAQSTTIWIMRVDKHWKLVR